MPAPIRRSGGGPAGSGGGPPTTVSREEMSGRVVRRGPGVVRGRWRFRWLSHGAGLSMRKTPQSLARLLITGGARPARPRARAACSRARDGTCVRPGGRRGPTLPAEWLHADVRDTTAMAAATQDVDAVIHTAYRQGEDEWSTNVDGSECVARASAGVRLIHLSTDLVFDGLRGRYREDDAVGPVNSYGRSKAEAERRVAARASRCDDRTHFAPLRRSRAGAARAARARGLDVLRRRDPLARARRRPSGGAARAAGARAARPAAPRRAKMTSAGSTSRSRSGRIRRASSAGTRRAAARPTCRSTARAPAACSERACVASTTAARLSVRRGSRRSPPAAGRRPGRRAERPARPGRDSGRGRGSRCRP